MSAAQPKPKPARRGLWLAVVIVGSLLALSTWEVVRTAGENSAAALRRAAFDGDEAKVRRILAAHPEWIDVGGSTNTQVHPSASVAEIIQIALGKPAPPPSSPEGRHEEEFREIEASGATALVHAVMRKQDRVAQLLLKSGASVRVNDQYGDPLVTYVVSRANTNLLASFEAHGAMRHAIETGCEPYLLHDAVHGGRVEMIQHIMRRGAHSLEVTNSVGGTPLWLAIASHRVDLVQLLATNGANLTCVPARGETAIQVARQMASTYPSSNATAVVTWLEAYTATNQPPPKPSP
jgi:hypothetical protein